MLIKCWLTVYNADPLLNHYCFSELSLFGIGAHHVGSIFWEVKQTRDIHTILIWCWPIFCDADSALQRPCVNGPCFLGTDQIRSCLKNYRPIPAPRSRIISKNTSAYCRYTNMKSRRSERVIWILKIHDINTNIHRNIRSFTRNIMKILQMCHILLTVLVL